MEKKILVFSNGEKIGDGIIKLPLLYEIKKRLPEYKLVWVTNKGSTAYRDKLKFIAEQYIDEIIEKADLSPFFWMKISKNYDFPKTLKSFLDFVAFKNRLFFLEKIVESFLSLVSKNKGEIKAKFISAKRLSEKEQNEIQNELSKDFKSKLNINYSYDPSLIAGLIIQVGSIMVDTSVKTKLKQLEKKMIEV